ncbi:MAG: extracellular solute-binding protein, partial [Chloroflexota bacterium]
RRRFLSIFGAGASVALLSACAQNAPTPTQAPAPTQAAAPTKAAAPTQAPAVQASGTAVFWFNQPAQMTAFQTIVDRFHKSQSKVKLEVVLVPTTDLRTKLATSIAGGAPPDGARLHGSTSLITEFKDHLANLEDWEPNLKSTDWIPGLLEGITRDGKIKSMPCNSGCFGFIYNPQVYKDAGLDPDKPPTTQDELLAYAKQISKPDQQIWGHYTTTLVTQTTGGDYFKAILWGHGGSEVSADGKKATYNSPQAVAAFQWYIDLVQKNKGMPVQQVNETQLWNAFLTGKVGSIGTYPSGVANIAKAPFKSISALYPKGPVDAPHINLGFATIGVFAKGKNPEAGWEFAKFIGLDPDNLAFWNAAFGQLPPTTAARNSQIWKDYAAKTPLVDGFVEGQKLGRLPYYGPGAAEMENEAAKAIEAVVFGQKTAQQAADDCNTAAQAILDRVLKQ